MKSMQWAWWTSASILCMFINIGDMHVPFIFLFQQVFLTLHTCTCTFLSSLCMCLFLYNVLYKMYLWNTFIKAKTALCNDNTTRKESFLKKKEHKLNIQSILQYFSHHSGMSNIITTPLTSLRSQQRTVLSRLPVQSLEPSGEMSIQLAPSVWPCNWLTSCWLCRSHTAIVPSLQQLKHDYRKDEGQKEREKDKNAGREDEIEVGGGADTCTCTCVHAKWIEMCKERWSAL